MERLSDPSVSASAAPIESGMGPSSVPDAAATARSGASGSGATLKDTLRVTVRDEAEAIGEGTHRRVVVNVARFDERVPGLAVTDANVGIFSRRCTLAAVLRDGDRVEVYRPLRADPKDTRRKRAALQKQSR